MAEQQAAEQFYDAFISYGRADSRQFAISLHQYFVDQGYRLWFDSNDIPLGVDFQNQIDEGILRAHNFVFLISPHSVNSDYCLREIQQAIRFNKRIIPVLHVESIDQATWQKRNPNKTDAQWEQAKAAGQHSCYENMHPAIGKINWVYCREGQDDIESGLRGLKDIIERHRDYVFQHTYFLNKALEWQRLQKQSRYLLIQSERQQAEAWLKVRFAPEQPPCIPTDLHCELITESIQNANNLRTQTFLAHADVDRVKTERVRHSLLREGITVWTSRADIKTGSTFQQELNRGIEQADNLIYLISPDAIKSTYCQQEVNYALSLNKRVIPLLIESTPLDQVPEEHRALQFIDFTEENGHENARSKLLKALKDEAIYHEQHTRLLVKAIKWRQQNHNDSLLLRGYNLRNADTWLHTALTRSQYGPIELQSEFIQASLQRPTDESLDVFVSYSRADSDFTRKLNDSLQTQGKTTWFDQESIDPGADFQQEIYQGIATSDNFLFVISPSSVSSPYCNDEVDYACQLNKRIITVVHRPVAPADLHPELAKVQWIDFNQHEGEFYPNFSQVVRTIEYDREHVRNHTKWSQRAMEWEQRDRTEDLLLRGSELTLANTWFDSQKKMTRSPAATSLLKTFINACVDLRDRIEREREERRLKDLRQARRIALGTTLAGMLMAGLSLLAAQQARQAKIGQIENLLVASQAHFEAEKPFEALLTSLEGNIRLKQVWWPDRGLQTEADATLRQMTHAVQEADRLAYGHSIVDVSVSPDGRYVALVGCEDTVDLWDLETRTLETLTIENSDNNVDGPIELVNVDFRVDGQQLALADSNGNVYLQNLNGDPSQVQFTAHNNVITQVRYSPDGEYLATTSQDGKMYLWTLQGQPIQQFDHHQDIVWDVAFGANGQQFATASEDKTVHVIDVDGNAITPPIQHSESAVDVHFSADNQFLATASIPALVNLKNLTNAQQQLVAWDVDLKGQGLLQRLLFSPNGQHMVTATSSGALELWDLAGNLLDTFVGHNRPITSISFSPDGQYLVSGSDDGTARLWRIQPESFRHVHKPNDSAVVGVSFNSSTGHLVTEFGPRFQLWTLDGRNFAELPGYEQGGKLVQVSADGQIVATLSYPNLSDNTELNLWQIDAGVPNPLALGLSENVLDISLSVNGDYFAVLLQTGITQLWSIDQPQTRLLFEQIGVAMDLSADGQTMATLTEAGVVELFDRQGNLKTSFAHPDTINPDEIQAVTLSSDGQHIATWVGIDIYLWDASGNAITTLTPPASAVVENYILEIAISPDGQWLATATETGAHLFSTAGEHIAHFPHPDAVTTLQFSPDSNHLITRSADEDGTARVWQVETPDALLARSCQWVNPYLQTRSNQTLEDDLIDADLCQNIAK
ncbi:MAG: TIR domain-containing protein [Leptolyngbyaceae cyanobacterium MAG.088]|nr:TIR domain-containing protein [Leptolyngbyaceae cyanobacterium MAG.088]